MLLVLLLITPADLINQALHGRAGRQARNIFVIAGCYTLTLIVAVVVYVNRLYTTRQLLEDIPKRFVPIKKGDVPGRVRRRIAEGLSKGAVLAWQSKPRARGVAAVEVQVEGGEGEGEVEGEVEGKVEGGTATTGRAGSSAGSDAGGDRTERQNKPPKPQPQKPHPIWGPIAHPGWSPPDSPDLPNISYASILSELPHLIEAKALSLALSHPSSPTPPDLVARKPCMSLARYISYLATLGYVDPRVGELLVAEYEKCRFWLAEVDGVSEREFRWLMKVFAALLRGMEGDGWEGVESLGHDDDDHDQDDFGGGDGISLGAGSGAERGGGGVHMRGGIPQTGTDADVDGYSLAGSSISIHTGASSAANVSIGTFGSVIARPPIPLIIPPVTPQRSSSFSSPQQQQQQQQRGQGHRQGAGAGYTYDPARDTDYDTEYEYEYTDDDDGGGGGLSRRSTREEGGGGGGGAGGGAGGGGTAWGGSVLRRVFTQSTTQSGSGESTQEGSVRRGGAGGIGMGMAGWGSVGVGRRRRRSSVDVDEGRRWKGGGDELVEMRMRNLSSSSRAMARGSAGVGAGGGGGGGGGGDGGVRQRTSQGTFG